MFPVCSASPIVIVPPEIVICPSIRFVTLNICAPSSTPITAAVLFGRSTTLPEVPAFTVPVSTTTSPRNSTFAPPGDPPAVVSTFPVSVSNPPSFCVIRFTAPPFVLMLPAPTVSAPVLSVSVKLLPAPVAVFEPITVSVFPTPTVLPV